MNIVIHSTFTEADCNALAEFSSKYNNSKSVKSMKTLAIVTTCIAGFAALLSILIGSIWNAFVFIVGIAAIWWIVWYSLNKKMPAVTRKINSNLFGGSLTFAFYDEYMYEKSETPMSVTESSTRYEGLSKVSEMPEYFFFSINESKIFVVPKRDIPFEQLIELEQFFSYRFGPNYNRIVTK